MRAKLPQSCPTLCNPMDYSPPGSLCMGFFRQEYWSGLPCPPPGDLYPGIELTSLMSPVLVGGFFTTDATRSPPRYEGGEFVWWRYVAEIHTFTLFLSYHLQSFMAFSFLFKNLKVVLKFYCLNPNSGFWIIFP